jgi:hypothetical protein
VTVLVVACAGERCAGRTDVRGRHQPGLDSHTQFSFAGAARWFDFIQHHPAVRSAGVPIVEVDLNYPLNPVRILCL